MPENSKPAPGPESTFTARLKRFIDHLGLSQRAFARSVEVSPANVNNYCRGSNPPPAFLAAVARAYPQLRLRWLVAGDGKMLQADTEGAGALDLAARLVGQFVREGGRERGLRFDDVQVWSEEGDLHFEASGRVGLTESA
jgi:transcriptional regulator with XRE-family HTH domain